MLTSWRFDARGAPYTPARRSYRCAVIPAVAAQSLQSKQCAARKALVACAASRCRPSSTARAAPGTGEEALPEVASDEEAVFEEDLSWDAPLSPDFAGWDDPSPENFLVVLFAAVAALSLGLVALRLAFVVVSLLITSVKYAAVALLLVAFAYRAIK